jgi:hypothetical protein
MKKKVLIMLMALIALATGTFGQAVVDVSSGGVSLNGGTSSGNTTICAGSSLTMTVSYPTIDHVVWTSNIGGASSFSPNNNSFTVTVNPTVMTDYIVYVYDSPLSIVPQYVTITVFVKPLPISQSVTANGVGSKVGHYCTAGTIFGLTSSEVGCTYQLQIDGTSTKVGLSVPGTGTAIQFSPVSSGNYQILSIMAGCPLTIR